MKAKALKPFQFGLIRVKEGQEIEIDDIQAVYLIPRGFVAVPGITARPKEEAEPATAIKSGVKIRNPRRKK